MITPTDGRRRGKRVVELAAHNDPREQIQAAIMMVEDGFSVAEVARLMDIKEEMLRERLKPSRAVVRRLRRRRHKDAPVCTICGGPMTYRSKKPRPVCRPCVRRHDEAIIRLWNQGLNAKEIAERFSDMTSKQVSWRVRDLRNRNVELARRR